jgi:hypothetical protein
LLSRMESHIGSRLQNGGWQKNWPGRNKSQPRIDGFPPHLDRGQPGKNECKSK